MNIRCLLILLMYLCASCKSDNQKEAATTIRDNAVPVAELEKQGFEAYQKSPVLAIPIFKKVAEQYREAQNGKKTALTYLNIANLYDEHKGDIDSAMIYSHKSLATWTEENDTMQMANLYKYIGLLKGRNAQYEDAELSINTAIGMYKQMGFEQGVAVSEFNMADVHYQSKNYNEGLRLYDKSKDFWVTRKDTGRIYAQNILGVKLYDAVGNKDMVQKLIKENQTIESQKEVNKYVKEKFDELIENL